jgi:hypothetical protein
MLKEMSCESATQQAGFEAVPAHGVSNHGMKRTYFPGVTDIVVVTDPAEVRAISNDARFDRDFIREGPVGNVQRLRKILRVFSLNGRRFPPCCRAPTPTERPRKTNCG